MVAAPASNERVATGATPLSRSWHKEARSRDGVKPCAATSLSATVRSLPGRLSALGISHRKSVFVWARWVLNGPKRRFPAPFQDAARLNRRSAKAAPSPEELAARARRRAEQAAAAAEWVSVDAFVEARAARFFCLGVERLEAPLAFSMQHAASSMAIDGVRLSTSWPASA
jgi:hypothetical protein